MLWWDRRKLTSKDGDSRRKAAEKLVSNKKYAPLIDVLTNDSRDVRETVIAALANIDDPGVFESLRGLLENPNADRRRDALLVLGKCAQARFIEAHQPFLCEIATNDPDRGAALATVELLSADPCVEEVMFKAKDIEVRKSALAKMKPSDLRPAIARLDQPFLFELAKTAEYGHLRELIIGALKTPEFVKHFADRAYDAEVRRFALEHPNCPPDVLAAAARDDPDEEARVAAIRNPNMTDRAALEAYAKADSALIAENAASRLAELDIGHVTDDSELELLVDAGKDEAIRTAALKKIKDQKMLTRIALSHGDAWIRSLAADCLKDDEARFWVAANTADPEVHRKAGRSIIKDEVGRKLAHELLLRFLSGSKEEIRHAAELIRNHVWAYPTREAIGEIGLEIVNRLAPIVNYSDTGPMRGRRDTFEWLVLAYLNDTENPHHAEYLPELKRWASRISGDKIEWAKRAGVPL